ncbi:MAG: hypothetical protein KF774_21815 [Planctomyces sp.]|nr:hypothetical protein [Planctomyces sp.]
MFRSTLRLRFGDPVAQGYAQGIADAIGDGEWIYMVRWRSHSRADLPPHIRRRLGRGWPREWESIAVDLGRSDNSRRHLQGLEARLGPLLNACRSAGALDEPSLLDVMLDMTASNGRDPAFIRRMIFSPSLLALCATHRLTIQCDVVPMWEEPRTAVP